MKKVKRNTEKKNGKKRQIIRKGNIGRKKEKNEKIKRR